MNPILITVVVALVAGALLAFYMDWLDLWVSKADMKLQVDRAKQRMPK